MTRRRSAISATPTGWGGLPVGSKLFVDTAPVIFVLESHPIWADRYAGLFEAAADGALQLALSTVTLAEVLAGPHRTGQTALAKRFEIALCQYEVRAVTVPVAALAARLRAELGLKLPDALQLATALDCGAAAMVTHDRDFSHVTALPVLTLA